jgi:DNA-binding transcriptional MerR regulator
VADVYTIEEAARRTGVSTHTLRYYERIGLLEPVGRASSGHRRYTGDDLGTVTFLTLLRQTGMPIRQMLRFVELTRAGDTSVAARVALLEDHRDALAAQLELLKKHFAAIETKIGVYQAMLKSQPKEYV